MITFEHGIDARCREPLSPCVARLRVADGYRFIVIGTQYGYWRTTGGDVRTWATVSGACKAIKRYVPL